MNTLARCVGALVLVLVWASAGAAQAPVLYRVTFPAPEHHWLQVEMTVTDLGNSPLRARMSRSSPGRYAVHEFAKNVFFVEAFDSAARRLHVTRPDVDEWQVGQHDGTVRVVYRVFGDHPDGTYMGVDTTHAHLNMPAAFMWADGQQERPLRVTFVPPAQSNWRVATQLFSTDDPWTYTAPNLQYFMDSPTELSAFVSASFTIPRRDGTTATFRVAAHADATPGDVEALATSIARLVREQVAVYGDLPVFEPGHYTFILDYVPWGEGDAMEHRNSTFIADPSVSLRSAEGRSQALDSVSHEFFHVWNVERIRPADLEPFDFTRQNITCCLWLAEGFTQYYGQLLLIRAGLGQRLPLNYALAVANGPGRQVRSAVQMSEYAPFADAGLSNDATDASRTFVSYYTYGAGLALGLDLALRDLTNGRVSLDDFMRTLWERHGMPADPRPGYVARPYTLQDLRAVLADVSGDRAFADEFFDRYVEGRESMDYKRLLSLAGYSLNLAAAGRGWLGNVLVDETGEGLIVGGSGPTARLVAFGTPAYDAGLDAGDVIVTLDGRPATMVAWSAIDDRKPGERIPMTIRRRDGRTDQVVVTLAEDPRLLITPGEMEKPLTDAQRQFRAAWFGSRVQ